MPASRCCRRQMLVLSRRLRVGVSQFFRLEGELSWNVYLSAKTSNPRKANGLIHWPMFLHTKPETNADRRFIRQICCAQLTSVTVSWQI